MVLAWGCGFLVPTCARALRLPALLCCEAIVWAVTFLAFPLRLLTSVDRERKLGRLIEEMQGQMDDLVRENKDLEEKLMAAAREQEAMEAVLDEMEEEHDDAFARIHALQTQLKALRQENMRLNEHKGKSMWDKPPDHLVLGDDGDANKASGSHNKKQAPGRQEREEEEAAAAGRETQDDPASLLPLTASPEASSLAKLVARRRSLFSLGMSVAVGAVAWSAEAPCLPLLAGLFAVVGVSMRSVSRSCAALRRGGPAADAVALLSLNWFLLGMLTSPMLPGVVRTVVPRVIGPAQAWFAAATPTPLSTLNSEAACAWHSAMPCPPLRNNIS